jgi:hypothetical protein
VKYMLSLWLSFFGKEEFLEYLRTILGINIEHKKWGRNYTYNKNNILKLLISFFLPN